MRPIEPGLVGLALRRTLPPWLLGLLLVLLLLAARGAEEHPLAGDGARSLAAARALARQDAWSVLFLAAPLFFFLAARLGSSPASEWLVPTPAPRAGISLALGAGTALACAAATLATALASEFALEAVGPAWRAGERRENPAALLADGAAPVAWSSAALPPGAKLRLWTTVAPGSGPAVSARFTMRAGADSAGLEARVAGRTALELAPPGPASGALELELARAGPGAVLVLPPRALQVLVPASSERLCALALGARAFCLLLAGCTLALGLARHLRPGLAALLTLALALLATTRAALAHVTPAGDLARAWEQVSTGLVPEELGPWPLLTTAGAAGLGLLLHARSLGRARRPA